LNYANKTLDYEVLVAKDEGEDAAAPEQSSPKAKAKEEAEADGAYAIPPSLMELNVSHNLIKEV
jgi:hypothetical protein